MKVYFISGLAADNRVFNHIRLPGHCEVVYLDWIAPLKNESLESYALRLAIRIETNEPFAIIGVSMGGMVATEISRHFRPVITILISSIPSVKHLPFYLRAVGAARLHRMIPVRLLKFAAITKRIFTNETSEDKKMLRMIIRESDPRFIRWAMHAILTWKNEQFPSPYIHIHGSKDVILPISFTKPTHIIRKGGHLMVMTRASDINSILTEVLSVHSSEVHVY